MLTAIILIGVFVFSVVMFAAAIVLLVTSVVNLAIKKEILLDYDEDNGASVLPDQ